MTEDGETTVRVNFGKPLPIFPLNVVLLMPHGVKALHIFEPRYRDMVADVLDSSGQFALATFEGESWREEYHGEPPLRPAVCVSQIIQHHKLNDGRYNIIVRGICRARIVEELPPDADHLYRQAMLDPLGSETGDEEELAEYRERLTMMLDAEPLADLTDADEVLEHLRATEIPATAILELVTLKFLTESEVRYRLLATGDPLERAEIVEVEVERLRALLRRAQPQRHDDCPKGCNWN